MSYDVCHRCGRNTCICRRSARVVAAALAAALGLALVVGCSSTSPPVNTPRSTGDNDSQAEPIPFPDGLSSAATKCDHGNRLYIAYHDGSAYAAIAVVPGDPTCK